MRRLRGSTVLFLCVLVGSFASCSTPELKVVNFNLKNTDQINDGVSFKTHIFQLKDAAKFNRIEWETLLKNPVQDFGKEELLGDAFITTGLRDAFLQPSSHSLPLTINLDKDAKFIGFFGRFKKGNGTPKLAIPVQDMVNAIVVVEGFGFRLQPKE